MPISPHELRPLSRDDASRYRLESTPIAATVLARIGFGADVSIDTDHPGGAWAINIPLSGSIASVSDGREIVSEPGQATLNPPDTPDGHHQLEQELRDHRLQGRARLPAA